MSDQDPSMLDSNRRWASVGIDTPEQCEELALEAIKRMNVVAMDLVEATWEDGSTEKNCMVFALDEDQDITVLAHVASGSEDEDYELLTATPVAASNFGYDFQFEVAADYQGPTEGMITGLIQGQPITFIDPLYLTNRELLDEGDEIAISLCGIAFELSRIPEDEVVLIEDPEIIRAMSPEESEGKSDDELTPLEVEVAGTVSLLPREHAEYDLVSFIQEVEEVSAFGKEFYRLSVGLVETDDFEELDEIPFEEQEGAAGLEVDADAESDDEEEEVLIEEEVIPMTLYVLKSNCKEGYVPVVGDAFEAHIWLQGVILDDDEDEEEELEEEVEG